MSDGRPAAILAVDGGGSKVDAAVIGADGRLLGAARWRGSAYEGLGRGGTLVGLARAVELAAADAGRDGRVPVARLGMYSIAGADFPADERRIGRALARRGWAERDVVRNDTFAVLRAGTDAGWGVAVVCGSGLNCSGIGPDGRTVRFPALGTISGDWGGGTDLGLGALAAALRARDGRGPRTELEHVVPAAFGLPTVERVMTEIHSGRLAQERLKELVPGVFGAAERGDEPARALVARQAEEAVAMATATIRRLRLRKLAFDVVLGGGVLQAGHAPLVDAVRDGVVETAPRARVSVLEGPPLVGAAMLALDELSARRAASSRLRASLTNDRLTRYEGDEEEA